MRIRRLSWSSVMCGAALLVTGCSQRPQSEIDAANGALDGARRAEAATYAPGAMRETEAARETLEAELRRQDEAWMRSYDVARQLAVAMKTAAEQASARAQTERASAARLAATRAPERRERIETNTTPASRARVTNPVKIRNVVPHYPDIARSARVDGTVRIAAMIGADGSVGHTRIVRSVPLLDHAALDAVRQWQYRPAMRNGRPVPVRVTVDVKFADP